MGNKTVDELDEIAEITGIDIGRILNLRKIDDNLLSEIYSEEELTKVAEAFGVEFQDLFEKDS